MKDKISLKDVWAVIKDFGPYVIGYIVCGLGLGKLLAFVSNDERFFSYMLIALPIIPVALLIAFGFTAFLAWLSEKS